MGMVAELGGRIRAILIIAALMGVVLIDSVSKIISICADGFLATIVLVLIWPLIKTKKEHATKQ